MDDALGLYFIHLLNGLAYGLLLFLLAAGLSLTFGMLDVLNLAHGSFYMLGAYLGLFLVGATGQFWLALPVAPLVVAALGAGLERTLLRPLYRRGHLDQVLLTLGVAFVALDLVKWLWGADVRSLPPPPGLAASIPLLGQSFPRYRLFVIAAGLLIAGALWLVLDKTRLGALVRAGAADREMASVLGVDVGRLFSLVFGFGAGLAALGGVIAAPVLGLFPGMDFQILIIALIVVVVGRLGTLKGTFWASLLVGQAETWGKVIVPQFALFLVFAIMAAVLLVRPPALPARRTG